MTSFYRGHSLRVIEEAERGDGPTVRAQDALCSMPNGLWLRLPPPPQTITYYFTKLLGEMTVQKSRMKLFSWDRNELLWFIINLLTIRMFLNSRSCCNNSDTDIGYFWSLNNILHWSKLPRIYSPNVAIRSWQKLFFYICVQRNGDRTFFFIAKLLRLIGVFVETFKTPSNNRKWFKISKEDLPHRKRANL